MTTVSVKLPKPHKGQKELLNKLKEVNARFVVLIAGRRWGKSRFALIFILKAALDKPGNYWYISPTHPMGNITWRLFKRMVRGIPGVEIRESERTIIFGNGSLCVWKSADRADSLRGEGLSGVVLDECSFIREDVWQKELRPGLSDNQGWALFITTPSGKNWIYRLYVKALNTAGWLAEKRPTWDNPKIPAEEIETAKEELPALVFDQEYGAEFVDDGSSIFRKIHEATTVTTTKPADHHGHKLYFGIDLAKASDFTVVSCTCKTCGSQVFMDRWNKIDYTLQVERIVTLWKKWKPAGVVVETNNTGVVVIELLRKAGVNNIIEFTTTASTKPELIERLAIAIENGSLKLLDDPVQTNELQIFGLSITRAGHKQYSAPDGYNDDTVIALGLSWHGCLKGDIQFY